MAVSLMRGSLRSMRMAPAFGAIALRQGAPPTSSALLGTRFSSDTTSGEKVDIATAKAMPRFAHEFSNESLIVMAANGANFAHRERMVREIMSVDDCTWDEAQPRMLEIENSNRSGMFLTTLPYKVGIATGGIAAFSTFPLCFNEQVAL